MALIDSIIGAESGGNPNATNPNSSATGLGQFINSTWLDTIKSARPDLAQGKSDSELLALRADPQLSREMTEAYAAKNGAFLAKNGLPVTPGTTYLAHFAGPQGAVSVLQADPGAPISAVLSPDAVKANPFLKNMTIGDLRAWADRKMGGAQPAPATPAAPANGLLRQDTGGLLAGQAPAGPALQIAPQPPPVFPRAVQQEQPQATPQQDFMAQMGQPPPIFFAPRRAPDLRSLQAVLRQPMFAKRT